MSMTYEWKVLRFPDIIVVDSHEDDPVEEGQAAGITFEVTDASHAQDITNKSGNLRDVH